MRRQVLLLALPLALAGCGKSSSQPARGTSTVAAPSAADFVAAGNAVCKASDERIFKIGRLSRDPAGWKKTAVAARKGVVEMRRVKPPPARRAQFARMLRYANALSLTIQEIHLALVKHDVDTAAAGQFAAAQLQDEVHRVARALGLTFCQQALTNWPA